MHVYRFATLFGVVLSIGPARADDFFETKVRPVLAENCFKCHGPAKQKGGIRLDSPEHLRAAADGSGPVVVPGKPDESRLIRAVRQTGEVKMPPGKKLPDAAVAALTDWVKAGAPWPAIATKPPATDHWAFRPIKRPSPPDVKGDGGLDTDLDRFVWARLEAKGLSLSPPADRRVLLRRVTFDLTGLPPTPEEVDAFLKDVAADAFARAVDRLLASPAFGERWGRHWLDVARYSDTAGMVDGEVVRYPSAYPYRDWVVKAFNADLPYDQFLLKQIAADHLGLAEGHPDLAALGFLTLGRKFENNEPDIIDDRLDVIFRGTQGLTLGCARCHDHKYDPLPIADYYSVYGVFANVQEREQPIIASPADRTRYLAYAAELRARLRARNRFDEAERRKLYGFHQTQADRYLLTAHSGGGEPKEEGGARADGLNQGIVERYRDFLEQTRAKHHPVMTPWHAFAGLKPEKLAVEAGPLATRFSENADADKPLNPLVARLFVGKPPADLADVARRYGRLFAGLARKWQRTLDDADARDIDRPERLPDDDEDEIRQLLFAAPGEAPLGDGVDDLDDVLPEDKQQLFNRLQEAVEQWKNGPEAPPMARVLADPDEPEPARVFIRGKADQPGNPVPRQFPALLAGKDRKPFADGTGRLELARAVASKDNPLTARVWVNRVWGHLFGRPLVETASDFGRRGTLPTHPELLDWLAQSLMDDGWSTRRLIRRIVLSRTYRQASADRTDGLAADPANLLLWRMNRRRLELEPLRDALLAAAGTLDRSVGGRPVDPEEGGKSPRRTLYLQVNRGNLPGLYRGFDFANPDLHSAGRHETTVPQQALFLLNSPFVIEQARGLAKRASAGDPSDDAFVRRAYRFALGREPADEETAAGQRFLRSAAVLKNPGPLATPVVWKYGTGQWDSAARRLTAFTPFAHFKDEQWQAGPDYPDPKFAYASLRADGGHPGEDQNQVVVRRWVAPGDGNLTVAGRLKHILPEGEEDAETNGVMGYVVANGKVIAEADVVRKEAPTNAAGLRVRAGDTIDFVVDPKGDSSYDSFTWRVHVAFEPAGRPGTEVGYDSTEDFRGPTPPAPPPLTPREKLAQVLLMSNEFIYVD